MSTFNQAAMRPTTTTAGRSGADPLDLDPSTAGRLLDGLAADDAPAAYAPVAKVLAAAARSAARPEELAGESAAVASFAAVGPQPARHRMAAKGSTWLRSKVKAGVAVLVGGLTLTTGLAAAGALPGAAQSVASEALERVGITVPNPNEKAGDHPDSRGSSADEPATNDDGGEPAVSNEAPDGTHGAEVSGTARTTDAEGQDKGAEVSGVASDGKSRAGDAPGGPPAETGPNGQAEERKPDTPAPAPAPPVDTPKGGRP